MDDAIARAAEVLKREGASAVYVFGSHARGTPGAESDIDLAVSGIPPARFFRAMSRASDAAGGEIDLVDLDENSPLARSIRQSPELRRVA